MDKELNNKIIPRNLKAHDQPGYSTTLPSGRVLLHYVGIYQGPDDLEEYYSWLEQINRKHCTPQMTDEWLAKTFPEAKHLMIRNLKSSIETDRKCLDYAEELRKQYEEIIYLKASKETEDYWRSIVENVFLFQFTHDRNALVHHNKFGLYPLKREERIKKNQRMLSILKPGGISGFAEGQITPEQIIKAKEYPMTSLIEFKNNLACCPFHIEKTPSFHYYSDKNRAHCYGCHKSCDAIDLYILLHNCSFKEAVRKLQ